MISSLMMVCAERVIRDAESNSISVINIMERIAPEGLPLLIPRLMILVILERDIEQDPSEIACKLKITIGGTTLVEQGAIPVDFQDKERHREIIDIGGLVIPSSGTLEASFWLEEKLLNQYRFKVKEPRQPIPKLL